MPPLSEDEFIVPANNIRSEIKVKGSRFLCTVIHCLSKEDAETEYTHLKKKYYDATHNCFAWRIDEQFWRYSDDGEPNGTAGKPILQVIDGKNLKEILCVVSRYFGGTKLGSGGLIRAYGDCTREALNKLKIKVKMHYAEIDIEFNYALESIVRNILGIFRGIIIQSDYSDDVFMKLNIPFSRAQDFKKTILEQSNSTIKLLVNNGCNY